MLCLTSPTDPAWVDEALADLGALLVDHAHCEMKAASNALSLAARHSSDAELVLALTDLAKEELDHYQRVVKVLAARGLALGTPPVDEYAAALRRASKRVGRVSPSDILVDRLLVGALIEARSCERFKLVCDRLDQNAEAELHAFYTELFACEARHFRTYVELAERAAGGDVKRVDARLRELADKEAVIMRSLTQSSDRAQVHG